MPGTLTYSAFKAGLSQDLHPYHPAIMWFWNHDITCDEIDFQLQCMRQAGIYEFYIHPLFGLQQTYLSTAFFVLIRHAILTAKALGMTFMIYDEYNWPSGSAGGILLKEQPWVRAIVLRRVCATVPAYERLSVDLAGEHSLLPSDDGQRYPASNLNTRLIQVLSHDPDQGRDVTSEACILDAEGSYTVQINHVSDTAHSYTLYYSEWNMSVLASARWAPFSDLQKGYLDLCHLPAVDAFIRYTHERYKEAIGDEFGRTVRGLFTDEPAFWIPYVAVPIEHEAEQAGNCLSWSACLPDEFQKRRGYDIRQILSALFSTTPSTAISRKDYWQTLAELFAENYVGRVDTWCQANGLVSTGHFLLEETFKGNLAATGDFFKASSKLQMPGIDSIFSLQHLDDYNFNLPARLVVSAAAFAGRNRILCETYTGSGWSMTMTDMKRIGNRLLVLGVNYIQYMGAYYSITSARKHLDLGYPPSHNWNNPLFTYYPELNRYLARLSFLSATTDIAADTAVLFPDTTARMLLGGGKPWMYVEQDPLRDLDLTLQGVVNGLLYHHADFLLIDENNLAAAQIVQNALYLTKDDRVFCFHHLLLPAVKYLEPNVIDLIIRFQNAGGRLTLVNTNEILDATNLRDSGLLTHAGIHLQDEVEFAKKVRLIKGNRQTNLLLCQDYDVQDNRFVKGQFTDQLGFLLNAGDVPFPIKGKGIFSCHRTADQHDYILLTNDTAEPQSAIITCNDPALVYDVATGNRTAAWRDLGGCIHTEIPPYDGVILVSGPEVEESDSLAITRPCLQLMLNGAYQFHSPANYYRLAPEENEQIQQPGKSFQIRYAFQIDFQPDILTLITESENALTWTINGHDLVSATYQRIWVKDNLLFSLAAYVRIGINVLVAHGVCPDYEMPYDWPIAVLSGAFSIKRDVLTKIQRKLNPVRPWKQLGLPNFFGPAVFTTEFILPQPIRHAVLVLWSTQALSVSLNGKQVLENCWPPYEADITSCLQSGDNFLEITITTGFGNLFEKPGEICLSDYPVIFYDV